MTREEAIKYLINPVATSTAIGEEKQKEFEAYNMAIEALSAEAEQGGDAKMTGTQPYMQQSRHDDGRITREEAMYLLNNLRSVAEGKEDEAIDMAIEVLSAEIPTKCIAQININADEIVKKIKDDYCSYGERRDESEVE